MHILHASLSKPIPRRASSDETGGLGLALLAALVMLMFVSLATLFSDPAEGQFLVIGSPFDTGNDGFMRILGADGMPIARGGFDNIMVAASERSDFSAALRAAGAWAVLPVPRFLGCSSGAGVARTNPSEAKP